MQVFGFWESANLIDSEVATYSGLTDVSTREYPGFLLVVSSLSRVGQSVKFGLLEFPIQSPWAVSAGGVLTENRMSAGKATIVAHHIVSILTAFHIDFEVHAAGITASGSVLLDRNSLIDVSANPRGVSGGININSPVKVLKGRLVP